MRRTTVAAGVVVVALAALALLFVQWQRGPHLTARYQAVLLTNGISFYGRLEGMGEPFPVLRDVFYVQSRTNPETKQVTNILIRRGQEWHAPDHMVLNASHILLVEPVREDSQVAKLIEEQQRAR